MLIIKNIGAAGNDGENIVIYPNYMAILVYSSNRSFKAL